MALAAGRQAQCRVAVVHQLRAARQVGVTDVGGMAEVVRLAQAGHTVSLTDPADMASAMLRLAANDAERQQFSANAQAAFHKHFTLTAMADAYMNLYRNTPRARRKR